MSDEKNVNHNADVNVCYVEYTKADAASKDSEIQTLALMMLARAVFETAALFNVAAHMADRSSAASLPFQVVASLCYMGLQVILNSIAENNVLSTATRGIYKISTDRSTGLSIVTKVDSTPADVRLIQDKAGINKLILATRNNLFLSMGKSIASTIYTYAHRLLSNTENFINSKVDKLFRFISSEKTNPQSDSEIALMSLPKSM